MKNNTFHHPATEYTCRHCGKNAGHDPELCWLCGPICLDCFLAEQYPCDVIANESQLIVIQTARNLAKQEQAITAGG